MRAALGFLFFSTSCSLVLKYKECQNDSDCARFASDAGVTQYCTSDHLCVAGVPDERLCSEVIGAQPDSAQYETVMLAALFRLSGSSSAKDKERLNGVRLAIEEVNNNSSNRKFGMVLCDTGGSDVV